MFGQHDHHDEDNNGEGHAVHTSDNPDNSESSSHFSTDTWQHPGVPPSTDDDTPQGSSSDDNSTTHQHDDHSSFASPADDHTSQQSDEPADTEDAEDENLADLKLQALSKLSPLVDHLDQSPEEKFRTLMMMIQASDDQSLIRQAYQTSLSISDEKERAQALLDIVNEINYFTQYSNNQ